MDIGQISETIPFGIGHGSIGDKSGAIVVVNDRASLLPALLDRPGVAGILPASMPEFMGQWERWQESLRKLTPDERWTSVDDVRFTAPIPDPWNIFQPYHNFERTSIVTGQADPPKSERVLPDFFFGSRSALAGYGDTVFQEMDGGRFDFEVEITAIIGKEAYRVSADDALDYVAGYCITNDFTMHHAWWRPIRNKSRINDNIRMKNFPGYSPVSRVIVPKDLVGDPHNLRVRTWVDDMLRQDIRTDTMLWSVPELIEYLSWVMPLRPGDMILCGSPGDLPMPEGVKAGVLPGQVVRCEIERIGQLVNPVSLQDQRPPYQPKS